MLHRAACSMVPLGARAGPAGRLVHSRAVLGRAWAVLGDASVGLDTGTACKRCAELRVPRESWRCYVVLVNVVRAGPISNAQRGAIGRYASDVIPVLKELL